MQKEERLREVKHNLYPLSDQNCGTQVALCGWCSLEVMWSWTWSERCVVVNILSTCWNQKHPCPSTDVRLPDGLISKTYHLSLPTRERA